MKITALLLVFTLTSVCANALDLKRLVTPETIMAHREALAFTSEQETELTRIYESAKAELAPLEEKVRREEAAINELLRSDSLEKSAAEASFTALLEAEAAVKHLQFTTLLSLRVVLTPEQIEKAVALESSARQSKLPLETTIEGKADRLKAAFDELGIKPSPTLEAKGKAIMELAKSGDLAAADQALDDLGKEVGIDEPINEATIDFSQQSTGNTDLDVLKQRYEAVEVAVQSVTSLSMLREFIKARDALEVAKAGEDAGQVGRILTWAENQLGITTAP